VTDIFRKCFVTTKNSTMVFVNVIYNFLKNILTQKNEQKLQVCCELLRNQLTGFSFLSAMIHTCTYLYSSNMSPQRWQTSESIGKCV